MIFLPLKLAFADTKATTESGLSSFLTSADETFQAIHNAFLNVAGVKSDSELLSKVEGQVKTLGNTLSEQVTELREEVNFYLYGSN